MAVMGVRMDERIMDKQSNETEIDLSRMMGALVSKAWLLGIVAVVCAIATFLGTMFFITPTYKSTAKFYVNNSSWSSLGDVALDSISSGDITAARGLVKTYIVILNTRETLNDVIDYAGVNLTYGQLKGMITAQAVDDTEVFQVVVTSPDPAEAEKVATAIGYILPNRIKDIIDGTSAKVVEAAVVAASPSSPNYTKNTLIGCLAGLLLTAALIILRELLDITVRTEEDVTASCSHPVLASVPDMENRPKGHHYGYGKYGKTKSAYDKTKAKDDDSVELVGKGISFVAAEAYKLLRTKLQFSFVDEGTCRIVGISSALTGEGKSLSAVNLAYTISQMGKRVLLVECDMRRPSLAEKLPVQKMPGLSDYLTGQIDGERLIQPCGIKDDEYAFHTISSGRVPPNPMELLGSTKMEKMLAQLRQNYDYIILDLPPVGEVGDALVAAKLTDGMLLVVRQNYCDRVALNEAVRQFEFVDAKILGIVFNCIIESKDAYGYRNRYYKKYYRRYYGRRYSRYYGKHYGRSYAKSHADANDAAKESVTQ